MAANASRDFDDAGRLTHLLWEVNARAASLSEAALAHSPLSPASGGVLDAIAAQPGTSIAEIARLLPMTAQNISQIVARLQRLGFVDRRLGARGYGIALFVTPDGDLARHDADEQLQRLDGEIAGALGSRDHAALVGMLDRARIVLETISPTATAAGAAGASDEKRRPPKRREQSPARSTSSHPLT